MYGAGYRLAETLEQFRQNLRESYTSEGIQIIEVRTDREENERWHRQIWKEISQAIKNVIR